MVAQAACARRNTLIPTAFGGHYNRARVMPTWMIIALSVAAGLGVLFLVLRWAKGGMDAARANMNEVAAGRAVRRESVAQSFGIRSKGVGQLRGIGQLALFDDELVFVQAIANNHVRAKRSDIVSVTTPRSFLGKTQGVKLLAVEWRTADTTDQIALRVQDLDGWLADLGGVTAPADDKAR